MGGFSEFDQNGFRKSSYLFLKSVHHVLLYFYKIEFKCKKLGKGNELKKRPDYAPFPSIYASKIFNHRKAV